MDENCIFCKIVAGKIPSKIAYEDPDIFAFHDVTPVAPLHILVIPKRHISSLNELSDGDELLLSKILLCFKNLATNHGISEKGYRVVNNCGEYGGQTVYHLHFHLLGGRHFVWPPG